MRDGGKEAWRGQGWREGEGKGGRRGETVIDREAEREGKGVTVRETNVRGEGRRQGGGMAMWEEKDQRWREGERR